MRLRDALRDTTIQCLTTGKVAADMMLLWEVYSRLGADLAVFYGHSGYIASDRSSACMWWLEKKSTRKLIQLDEDMLPPVDMLKLALKLDEPDVDLVFAPYLYLGDRGLTLSAATLDETAPMLSEPGLLEVAWGGTGMWAAKRETLLKIRAAEGAIIKFEIDEDGRKKRGTDVFFCARARALGMRVWLDRDLIAGHRKGPVWVPHPDGSISSLPWGKFWRGREVPRTHTDATKLTELVAEFVQEIDAETLASSEVIACG